MRNILVILTLFIGVECSAQSSAFDRFLGYSNMTVAQLKAKFNKPGWKITVNGYNKAKGANELQFQNLERDNLSQEARTVLSVTVEYKQQQGHESILSVSLTSNDQTSYAEILKELNNKITGKVSRKRFIYNSAVKHPGWIGNRYLDTETSRYLYMVQIPASAPQYPAPTFYVGYFAPGTELGEIQRVNLKK